LTVVFITSFIRPVGVGDEVAERLCLGEFRCRWGRCRRLVGAPPAWGARFCSVVPFLGKFGLGGEAPLHGELLYFASVLAFLELALHVASELVTSIVLCILTASILVVKVRLVGLVLGVVVVGLLVGRVLGFSFSGLLVDMLRRR